MIGMILGGAQVGLSLLQAREQSQALGDRLESQYLAIDAERAALERRGAQEARKRRQQLADTLSGQTAGLAASGVAGGRTQALLERDARLRASREQEQAALRDAFKQQQLDIRESQAKSGFRHAMRQSRLNMFGGALKGGTTMYTAGQQNKATEG